MSVNLDFDLLQGDHEQIFEKVKSISWHYAQITDQKNKHYTLYVQLRYLHEATRIKIEISKRWVSWNYVTHNFLGEQIQIMTQEDLFTNKLIALLHRPAITNRDIFDIRYFLDKGTAINNKLLEQQTGQSAKIYLQRVSDFIQDYDFNKILYGLGQLIDPQSKNFAKTKMQAQLTDMLHLINI